MAFALKCDICGKYFDYIQNKENVIRICHETKTSHMVGTKGETYDEYDTCPECMNSICALISTLKMNGGKKQPESGGK